MVTSGQRMVPLVLVPAVEAVEAVVLHALVVPIVVGASLDDSRRPSKTILSSAIEGHGFLNSWSASPVRVGPRL